MCQTQMKLQICSNTSIRSAYHNYLYAFSNFWKNQSYEIYIFTLYYHQLELDAQKTNTRLHQAGNDLFHHETVKQKVPGYSCWSGSEWQMNPSLLEMKSHVSGLDRVCSSLQS